MKTNTEMNLAKVTYVAPMAKVFSVKCQNIVCASPEFGIEELDEENKNIFG